MRIRNHIIVALGIAVLLAPLDPVHLASTALFTSIGALIPDLDLGSGHRKYLHNVFAIVAVYLVVLLATGLERVAFLIALGMLTHVASDALTRRGVALLWPISRKFYRVAGLRYDSRVFDAFSVAVLLLAVIARILYMGYTGAESLPLLSSGDPGVVMREPQI
ncbi:MAG: hypothetical protein DRO39_06385 [Thermoprotei archaeon]|nr:MAG: hypothetical protein DRO39_06385 [Thermoprotei archaeon]